MATREQHPQNHPIIRCDNNHSQAKYPTTVATKIRKKASLRRLCRNTCWARAAPGHPPNNDTACKVSSGIRQVPILAAILSLAYSRNDTALNPKVCQAAKRRNVEASCDARQTYMAKASQIKPKWDIMRLKDRIFILLECVFIYESGR